MLKTRRIVVKLVIVINFGMNDRDCDGTHLFTHRGINVKKPYQFFHHIKVDIMLYPKQSPIED